MAQPDCPVTSWVGADERPVFLDQEKWLSDAWNTNLVIEAKKHHFNVIEGPEDDKNHIVTRLLLE